jgi:D-alanyl-D-alanine carboxypeptidase
VLVVRRQRERRPKPPPESKIAPYAFALVEAVNAANPARLEEFVRSSISDAGIAASSPADLVARLRRVREQTGGVDLMNFAREDNPLLFTLKSRRGRRWAQVYMFADKGQADRIRDFGFMPLLDPRAEKDAPWIMKRMGEREVTNEIDKHVGRAARRDVFSGVVLVARRDRVIYRKAAGFAEQSFRARNRIDTKFHLGSASKMFTSIGIAQLVERGRLDFHTPLLEVLPEYPNPSAAKQIEIHHLLSHTAGLGGLFDRPTFERARRYRWQADHFPIFADAPLLFPPGTRYAYSNEGYVVLGAVLETLASKPYRDYVEEHILRPAGMGNTDAYPLDEPTPNRAVGYLRGEEDPFAMEPRRANWTFLGTRGNAAGGFYSTAPDLLRFAKALRGHRFLGTDMTETITRRQSLMPNYGYGFFVEDVHGRGVIGHGGGGPNSGVNAAFKMFRDGSYTVAVLSNYDAPVAQDLAERITELLALQG